MSPSISPFPSARFVAPSLGVLSAPSPPPPPLPGPLFRGASLTTNLGTCLIGRNVRDGRGPRDYKKDVLVVTAPSSGAEVIPFLKTYVNLPGAVAFTVLYSKLCNSAEQVQ